jgi:long-chain acyl-CoA synthetase
VYVTAQPDGDVRADTVGPAPDVEIRIAENGEVHVPLARRVRRLLQDDEKHRETKTPMAGCMTGDAGIFDAEGHLKIIDRAKDVGKLNDGALCCAEIHREQAQVLPEHQGGRGLRRRRDFVAVFLNIDLTAVGNWAERNNISYASYQELAPPAAGLRDDGGACRSGEPRPRGRDR